MSTASTGRPSRVWKSDLTVPSRACARRRGSAWRTARRRRAAPAAPPADRSSPRSRSHRERPRPDLAGAECGWPASARAHPAGRGPRIILGAGEVPSQTQRWWSESTRSARGMSGSRYRLREIQTRCLLPLPPSRGDGAHALVCDTIASEPRARGGAVGINAGSVARRRELFTDSDRRRRGQSRCDAGRSSARQWGRATWCGWRPHRGLLRHARGGGAPARGASRRQWEEERWQSGSAIWSGSGLSMSPARQ